MKTGAEVLHFAPVHFAAVAMVDRTEVSTIIIRLASLALHPRNHSVNLYEGARASLFVYLRILD